MSPSSDSTLHRAVSGDTDALSQLLEELAPRFRRRLSKRIPQRLQSAFDEHDVMQVTYLEAFLNINRFRGETVTAFERWLYRVAYNNLRDTIRGLESAARPPRNKQVRQAGGDRYESLITVLGFTTATPSRHAARSERRRMLVEAIDRLPPDYKIAVQLYDLEGRSGPEVAKAMGRSRGAVHMLLARGHDLLVSFLGSESLYFTSAR